MDANGYVYVADTANGLVRMVSPTGRVTTLAGSAAACYQTGCVDADGIGRQAVLSMPAGIAVDAAGNLYVTDFNEVRKLVPIH